jgi:hypothetical protein
VERHSTDPLALLFGLLFAGAGLVVLAGWDTTSILRFDILAPTVAILAGAGLVLSARRA